MADTTTTKKAKSSVKASKTTTATLATTSSSEVAPEETLFFDVQQKTDKQHILDNPDTYIGSVEEVEANQWVLQDGRIVEQPMSLVPGLYKLFDEAIVNCRDHVVRMQGMLANGVEGAQAVTHIDVSIDPADGTITMTNDGNGIDVVQRDGVWVPEMVFAQLRTSTNYNKDEKRIVGGKNGFGFKLVLIWSTYGRMETVDHIRGLKYVQEYHDNLDRIGTPTVTKCKTKPYTKITFRPDYARLQLAGGLSADMVALFQRRVHDIAAITDKNIKVRLNDTLLPIKTFAQYVDLYLGGKDEAPRVHEEANDRWEYVVAMTPNSRSEFVHVSFVNGIHTAKGGRHVDYIMNQLLRKLADWIEKKRKVKVNPAAIRELLILFLRCDVENPSFDSQTKDFMNTPAQRFGSKCEVSDKFVEKVAKLGILDAALAISEAKDKATAKKTDGNKTRSVRGIPKLTDANWAGTAQSHLCTLIWCEGDSAKAGILSGLSAEDRNTIGVYPLKGKLLNVRGEAVKKVGENKEIAEIKRILGLVNGQKYESMEDVHKHLRYGRVLFMTDQDLDGSHIKGLCLNLFDCEWPSLLQLPGFLGFMNTPILKARRGRNEELQFYNQGEFESWKQQQLDAGTWKHWTIKYYKGLGTSTGAEFKEYFAHQKIVSFHHLGDRSRDTLDMVFNKKRAEDRKAWLQQYDRHAYLNTNAPEVSVDEFVHREFIHFSKYDCDRSIPSLIDGLKISQRKILFAAFKRNLTQEIKVAQFSGYVSEHSGYHHGEASLNGTIVKMAQTFVGSNNLHVLMPCGQFGTRLKGGADHASERYIFTHLNRVTRMMFPAADDAVLHYLEDDGLPVEPTFYAPVLPMVLVNGTEGIGTGFSCEILCYHPLQLADYLQAKLCGAVAQDVVSFTPYYEGFRGTITPINPEGTRFLVKGLYHTLPGEPDKIRITELPVGTWTESMTLLLEHWIAPGEDKDGNKVAPLVKDYADNSSDDTVDFTVTLVKGKLAELLATEVEHGCNGLEKLFKLYTTCSTTNMHLFDEQDVLRKYDRVQDIVEAYFPVRLALYSKRKEHLLATLQREVLYLENKAAYIRGTLDGSIDLRRKSKAEVSALLAHHGLHVLDPEEQYDYLLKMAMDSVTEEHVTKLQTKLAAKQAELTALSATTPEAMWLQDLTAFREGYVKMRDEEAAARDAERAKTATKKKQGTSHGTSNKRARKA